MRPWRYAFSMAQRHDPSGATVAKAHRAAFDQGGYFVALDVDIAHAVFFNLAFGRRQKVVPDFGEYAPYFVGLAFVEGGTGIAVEAALSLARLEVAAKISFCQVKTH